MEPLTAIPPSTAIPTASAAPPGPSTASALSSDFETFLRMLTTQMRNQDPLNPIDSADFAVQLATFSSVEQQVLTNDLLAGLAAQMATLGMGQLAGWIGLEAEVAAPVRFAGAPVSLSATVAQGADAAELIVTNDLGGIVQRMAIAPRSGPVIWDGRDPSGLPLPDGTYRITAHSLARGDTIARHEAHLHARIDEARLDRGEVRLVLETGQGVGAGEVLGLRPSTP
ncbi:flagellar hook capping FlgD N-terminal domain-containing protein [Roseovarius autotrophicus]|uniref:flagellar hook capping FlgD N-terminal domain-containing protein n=1 Tax=Roseovarius autotrophicus TaxID=2824121 RepID=UPI001A026A57|nr:flagellar hook capping FlgD N-terminal domain-containing protein [Roseovarius autotrophicus]MBE0452861.1 flagellar hook assembly protein FlgD [Roseovarius sp.]